MDQKTKVDQQYGFFHRIFFPTHFDPWKPKYRVFFIEGQIRISCKMLKILLFHVGFGLRTEVIMGYLISDQFKTHF